MHSIKYKRKNFEREGLVETQCKTCIHSSNARRECDKPIQTYTSNHWQLIAEDPHVFRSWVVEKMPVGPPSQ